jgi:hypothetical protein
MSLQSTGTCPDPLDGVGVALCAGVDDTAAADAMGFAYGVCGVQYGCTAKVGSCHECSADRAVCIMCRDQK